METSVGNTSGISQAAPLERAHNTIKPFRLLDLPPELILRVLDFAVVRSSKTNPLQLALYCVEPDSAVTELYHRKSQHCHAVVIPAITRTCRMLHAEGFKKFMLDNTFAIDTGDTEFLHLMEWNVNLVDPQALVTKPVMMRWVHDSRFTAITAAWGDWCFEIDYFINNDLLRPEVPCYILTYRGKIVLDIQGWKEYYFLSFTQESNGKKGYKWVEWEETQNMTFDMETLDWWVPLEEAKEDSKGR